MSTRGLVIAAHGSRQDPTVNASVRRLAQAVRARRIFDEVAVAFHQGEPGFAAVLDELTADLVTVVPLFTSAGHYAEVVLPEALARNRRFADLRLRQSAPVGTHPRIASLVCRRLTELLRERKLDRQAVSLALVGHGTRRHRESRTATLHLAEILRRRRVAGEVLTGFIDDDPPLETLRDRAGLPHLIVLPFLIGGAHVSCDLPRRLGLPGERRVWLDIPIGGYPGVVDLVVDLARRNALRPAPPFRPRSHSPGPRAGAAYLVGGGPGDPGLITARGLELLRSAEVVIHDRLIGPELLSEARAGALLIDAGKGPGHAPYPQAEINRLLVQHARQGRTVVRLKGGDPFVFGRGSEEVEACRAGGVPVHVVPGVSSAIAGPAAAGIPVTARGVAQSFTVITGHTAEGTAPRLPVVSGGTLVVLMGRASLARLAAQLLAGGQDPHTPAACIQSATTPEQRITRATLSTIVEAVDRDGLEAPLVTVIGAVAALGAEEGRSSRFVLFPTERASGLQ